MSITGIDSSILLAMFQSRAGISTGTALGAADAPVKQPTAPWTTDPTPAQTSAAVKSAMAGHPLIDENGAKLDVAGASADYRKLFALYQGLSTLSGVAAQANGKGLTSFEKDRISQISPRG